MFKKALTPLLIFLFLVSIPPLFYLFNYSDTVLVSEKKIVYELPYPGILPDSPLYSVKQIRDKMLEAMTRKNIDKAKLYLLISDKEIRMTELLAEKGNWTLVEKTLISATAYQAKIYPLLKVAKQQGDKPTLALVDQLIASTTKHREVFISLKKNAPQSMQKYFSKLIEYQSSLLQQLPTFK
ncbi:MAG: DUF5667 domain-containing protein [Patescibacteria group bacterium]